MWINSLIKRAQFSDAPVAVSDVRFQNELEAIVANGGKLIRIIRPETDDKASKIGIKNHKSEQEQLSFSNDLFDVIIINDGLLKDLYIAIDKIVPNLLK